VGRDATGWGWVYLPAHHRHYVARAVQPLAPSRHVPAARREAVTFIRGSRALSAITGITRGHGLRCVGVQHAFDGFERVLVGRLEVPSAGVHGAVISALGLAANVILRRIMAVCTLQEQEQEGQEEEEEEEQEEEEEEHRK